MAIITDSLGGLGPSLNIVTYSSDHTLSLSDMGYFLRMDNGSAISLMVPKDSVINFPIGSAIPVQQTGIGTLTINPVDSDVTLTHTSATTSLSTQYSTAVLLKISANTWLITGDMGGFATGGSYENIVVRTVAGNYTALPLDTIIEINKTVPEATTIYLPISPILNEKHLIKDGGNNADVYNITINGNGKLIDGSSTYTISDKYGAVMVYFNGSSWRIY